MLMAAVALVTLDGLTEILLRFFVEGLLAAWRAEVVGLPFVLTLGRGRSRVNFHTTYRIFSYSKHLLYFSKIFTNRPHLLAFSSQAQPEPPAGQLSKPGRRAVPQPAMSFSTG